MPPSITVIVASRNGASTLPKVFEAIDNCDRAQQSVQFLLVDNASTDSTRALFDSFITRHTGEVLVEERPGKSHALNLALSKANGDIVAFLDDDAVPARDWFTAWEEAFEKYPSAGVFVGAVSPLYQEPPPAWLRELARQGMSCACTPEGLPEGHCSPGYTKGLNWALRRSALGAHLFDAERNNLVHAGKPVGGQDTEMARRIAEQGHDVVFVTRARAEHIVRPHEMTLDALFQRYQRIGRGVAAQGHKSDVSKLRLKIEIAILEKLSRLGWFFGREAFAAQCYARLAMRSGRLEMMGR